VELSSLFNINMDFFISVVSGLTLGQFLWTIGVNDTELYIWIFDAGKLWFIILFLRIGEICMLLLGTQY
jgi:hypothetical protein